MFCSMFLLLSVDGRVYMVALSILPSSIDYLVSPRSRGAGVRKLKGALRIEEETC